MEMGTHLICTPASAIVLVAEIVVARMSKDFRAEVLP
jgi:hypothetical protein